MRYAAKEQPSCKWGANQSPPLPCVYEEQCPLSTSLILEICCNHRSSRWDYYMKSGRELPS